MPPVVLYHHAHALVLAAVVTAWILAAAALWRYDGKPRSRDDDVQDREPADRAEVRLAA